MAKSLTLSSLGSLPVTLPEIKEHLRVYDDEENDSISAILESAVDYVERTTGRLLRPGTCVLKMQEFPSGREPIVLPRPPFVSLTSIAYTDDDGAGQTYAGALSLDSVPAELQPAADDTWPTDTQDIPGAVVVTWSAGYATAADVPKMLVNAVRLFCDLEYHEQSPQQAERIRSRMESICDQFKLTDTRLNGISVA